MTNEDLIRDYLSKGGPVVSCPPGSARSGRRRCQQKAVPKETRDPWWVRSDWFIIRVPKDRIAAAECWLREREFAFRTTGSGSPSAYHVRMPDARQATMFKLTFGGQYSPL